MKIKNHYTYFNTDKRLGLTEKQEQEYFNYLMDCIKEINVYEIHEELNIGTDDIGNILGQIIVNFSFWHNHGSMNWTKCQRMWDYSYRGLRTLGLV